VTANPEKIGQYVAYLRKSVFIKVTKHASSVNFPFVLIQRNIFNPTHLTYVEKKNFAHQVQVLAHIVYIIQHSHIFKSPVNSLTCYFADRFQGTCPHCCHI